MHARSLAMLLTFLPALWISGSLALHSMTTVSISNFPSAQCLQVGGLSQRLGNHSVYRLPATASL